MDIFALRKHIIDDYEAYTRSFLTIQDPQITDFVQDELSGGKLWPDALIQLSPAYAPAQTIADLAATGVLHPLCASIFRDRIGRSLTLYRHQRVRGATSGGRVTVTPRTPPDVLGVCALLPVL